MLSITGYRIEVSTDGTSWSDLVVNTDSTGYKILPHGSDGWKHPALSGLGHQLCWDGLDIKHGLRYHGRGDCTRPRGRPTHGER